MLIIVNTNIVENGADKGYANNNRNNTPNVYNLIINFFKFILGRSHELINSHTRHNYPLYSPTR